MTRNVRMAERAQVEQRMRGPAQVPDGAASSAADPAKISVVDAAGGAGSDTRCAA